MKNWSDKTRHRHVDAKATGPDRSQVSRTHGLAGVASAMGNQRMLRLLEVEGRHAIPAEARAPLEDAFGQSFADVEVMEDGLPASLGAIAATEGNRIHFAPGHLQTGTEQGRRLLAHELSHVVQQRAGRVQGRPGALVENAALERESDGLGNRAAAGERLLLPGSLSARAPSAPVIQAKKETAPQEITDAEIQAAILWAPGQLGIEAIRELRNALQLAPGVAYDEETARAVFALQLAKHGKGKIRHSGQADASIFEQLGLIRTAPIVPGQADAKTLLSIKSSFPEGITVAIAAFYKHQTAGNKEFLKVSDQFAAEQGAVGLDAAGNITMGGPAIRIHQVHEVVEVIQRIHRGLVAANADSADSAGGAGKASEIPPFTRIRNLALFTHGLREGLSLNEDNRFAVHSLHRDFRKREPSVTLQGQDPSNIEAFVRGIRDAVNPNVRVLAYACLSGGDPDLVAEEEARKGGTKEKAAAHGKTTVGEDAAQTMEWHDHVEGRRRGEHSFANELTEALGPDASVYAHLTEGPTTENYAARVFGGDSAAAEKAFTKPEGSGGLHLFDVLYPPSFVDAELARLQQAHPDKTFDRGKLRDEMWKHFQSAVAPKGERAKVLHHDHLGIGALMFLDPAAAANTLHKDFSNEWIEGRLDNLGAK